jgi:hypothetical protein
LGASAPLSTGPPLELPELFDAPELELLDPAELPPPSGRVIPDPPPDPELEDGEPDPDPELEPEPTPELPLPDDDEPDVAESPLDPELFDEAGLEPESGKDVEFAVAEQAPAIAATAMTAR